MSDERPSKPLKILTLDGPGLQAISTLLILDRLLENIRDTNQAPRKPRPCDVFDVICGIGPGGWLALLLGRFRLETKTAFSEWCKLLECIVPHSRSQDFRRRVLKKTYFDQDLLIERVKSLTDLYGTGDKLLDPYPSKARCKYVFVAAQKAHHGHTGDDYSLFRSYKVPDNVPCRSGSSDPESFTIASAFGVTGAAKYFSRPWKEHIDSDGKTTSFLDHLFPRPHNITLPALEEMWALFGPAVPISVVVNIGPGAPPDSDLCSLVRKFSFGLKTRVLSVPAATHPNHKGSKFLLPPSQSSPERPRSAPAHGGHHGSTTIIGTHGPRNSKLVEEEKAIGIRVRQQLRAHYDRAPDYYRFGKDVSTPGSLQNDSRQSDTILRETNEYCESRETVKSMDEVSRLVDIHDHLREGVIGVTATQRTVESEEHKAAPVAAV